MSKKNTLLKLTNDYVFKRIFGRKGNEDITKSFIKAATGIEYTEIDLEETPMLERDLIQDKLGILDVKVTGDKKNNIDLEMQVAPNDYIADRILWYWANMYVHSIEKGNAYDMTKKTKCILIADFDIKNLDKIPKYRSDFKLREEEYREVVLTDKLEIVIIELSKLDRKLNLKEEERELLDWCKFMKNPEKVEESIMNSNESIKRAKDELDKISQDARERRLAELREKAIMDEIALEKTGYNRGLEDGKSEGEKSKSIEIARNMLNKKYSIKDIMELTGLTEEEISKI